MSKKPMAYTGREKLAAELALSALSDLDDAFRLLRELGVQNSEHKTLKVLYLWVNASLNQAPLAFKCAEQIIAAPECPELHRLPAWDGYPDEKKTTQDPEA